MKPTNLIHRSLALLSGRLLLVALDAHAQPPIVPEEVSTAEDAEDAAAVPEMEAIPASKEIVAAGHRPAAVDLVRPVVPLAIDVQEVVIGVVAGRVGPVVLPNEVGPAGV